MGDRLPLILLSGMAADARLFAPQRAAFPGLVVPNWIEPLPKEPLPAYAARLARLVDPGQPCLVGGASFGGLVALEMAPHLPARACVLIASVRSPGELPWWVRLCRPAAVLGPAARGWRAGGGRRFGSLLAGRRRQPAAAVVRAPGRVPAVGQLGRPALAAESCGAAGSGLADPRGCRPDAPGSVYSARLGGCGRWPLVTLDTCPGRQRVPESRKGERCRTAKSPLIHNPAEVVRSWPTLPASCNACRRWQRRPRPDNRCRTLYKARPEGTMFIRCTVASSVLAVLLGRYCSVIGQEDQPFVSLLLPKASAERGEHEVLFRCDAILDNATRKDLAVHSAFFSAFDGLTLVVTGLDGKVLAEQGYTYHQSPSSTGRAFPLRPGDEEGAGLPNSWPACRGEVIQGPAGGDVAGEQVPANPVLGDAEG